MTPALSPLQRRSVALALLAMLVLVLGFAVALPTWGVYQGGQLALEEKRDRLVRLRRLASRQEVLEERLADLRRRVRRGQYTLNEDSPNLAAAALQKRIKGIVEEDGGDLKSSQVLSVVEEGQFTRVGINARMDMSLETLQTVLYELESGVPFLWVDNLTVASKRRMRRRLARFSSGSAGTSPLDVRFNVYGFMPSTPDYGGASGP